MGHSAYTLFLHRGHFVSSHPTMETIWPTMGRTIWHRGRKIYHVSVREDVASDSAVPYPLPLAVPSFQRVVRVPDDSLPHHVIFTDDVPVAYVDGDVRPVLEQCDLCLEKYHRTYHMWPSNWLEDVHGPGTGRDFVEPFQDTIYDRCCFCWDGADKEVREHAFQAKLRRLSRTTQVQSALLRLLLCFFCMYLQFRDSLLHGL